MKLTPSFFGVAVALCLAGPAAAQTLNAVGPYTAVTDRVTYPKPALPALGPAGSAIADPTFKSTIGRVTDGSTRPGLPNRSYRTPSSAHQNAWSANGTYFYVVSDDGTAIPFRFDASTGRASRINPAASGNGGLTISSYIEPEFSYVNDSLVYGSYNGSGSNLHTIDQYDFSTGAYTRLIDLETIVSGLSGTYIGGLESSAGSTERIMTFFGGTSQDHHHYVLVFDKANPSNRLLLDTQASTLNGQPTPVTLSFSLHAVNIDLSGRYVMLYPTSADQTSARQAPQAFLWDTSANTFFAMTDSVHPYGHDAFGYGVMVNQDCCTSTTWDGTQWQFRQFSTPSVTRDVLTTVLQPKEVYVEDHTNWNNAQPDRLVPFISAIFRYGTQNGAWRALDDEIVAVQSDAPGINPTIWRFAHHRSDVSYDGDATRTAFWYEPRPNVSHDGGWVLFTSNWEKTLGTDPVGDPGTGARQDVFLVQLRGSGAAAASPSQPPSGSRPIMNIDAPRANAAVTQPFAVGGWAIDTAATANSGVDWVDVWAFPDPGSNTAPIYVGGAPASGGRPDVGGYFGAQFTASGFGVTVKGLAPGVYQLNAYARSRVANAFNDVRSVVVTVVGNPPRMAIDVPGPSQTVGTAFMIAGWAFDPNGVSGSGVDAIHVWAYPNPGSNAAPVFVGTAGFGYARPDVAAAFGPAGASSGFGMIATLPPGIYDVVVFAHSTATGTFNQAQSVRVVIR